MTAVLSSRAQSALATAFPEGLGSFIDGEVVAGSGDIVELTDPTTGVVHTSYRDAGPEVLDSLLNSATAGAALWARTNPF